MYDNDENLLCPHCEREQHCHEPDEISALCCNTTCEHCGELFWYSVDVERTYSSYVDDS